MDRQIAIGGAAGFLGAYLTGWFLDRGYRVLALARRRAGQDVASRVRQAVAGIPDFGAPRFDRLQVLPFDLSGSEPSDAVLSALGGLPFINTIASLKHGEQHRTEILATNVQGTHQLLEMLARAGTRRLYHVSTAYVSGAAVGEITETPIDLQSALFNNLYEQSKAEAEALILGQQTVPADILRPSIIVGSSRSGWAKNYTGYYGLIAILAAALREANQAFGGQAIRFLPIRLPGDPQCSSDVVPVDFVAEAIGRIVDSDLDRVSTHAGEIFHLTNGSRQPNVFYMNEVQRYLGLTGGAFVPPESLQAPHALERWCAARLRFNASYTVREFRFRSESLRKRLGSASPQCPTIDEAILKRINDHFIKDTASEESAPNRDAGRLASLAWGLASQPGFLRENGLEQWLASRDDAPPSLHQPKI